MKRAYVAISFSEKEQLREVINVLKITLKAHQIEAVVFVEQYKFDPADEKQMMKQALEVIDSCDIFIAEVTYKQIGIGIEAGYAKGKNKPIVYLRHYKAEHSTTVSGISDFHIIYQSPEDLNALLESVLLSLML